MIKSQPPSETTIAGLFDPAFRYQVPPYQRAYSWKKPHWQRFLKDLRDQPDAKDYYLGHFILEAEGDSTDSQHVFNVIDGQQRLTTIVIFFSCTIRELERRLVRGDGDAEARRQHITNLRQRYLRDGNGSRLITVDYDQTLFTRLIIHHSDESVDPGAPRSQKLIREARDYFIRKLTEETCSTDILIRWCDLIETAFASTFTLTGEKARARATQIFAYQNDRGIKPTRLELLKAYLMHQVYLFSRDGSDDELIEIIQSDFAEIHRIHEAIETLEEDQVLAHHCMAFVAGWEQAPECIENALAKIAPQDKLPWIRDFSSELRQSFRLVKDLERDSMHDLGVADLLFLDANNSWPLLLKLHRLHGPDHASPVFRRILRLMEITLFKKDFSRADFRTNSFHEIAKNWNGDIGELTDRLENCAAHGFKDYWQFNRTFRLALRRPQQYCQATRYLLWKHENWLAERHHNPPLLPFKFRESIGDHRWDETIEHIMPQYPDGVELGEAFRERHLHCLGNLALMTRSKNASASNELPAEKRDHFLHSGLISHKQILQQIEASESEHGWGPAEIESREDEIVSFALEYWEAPSSTGIPEDTATPS